MTNPKRPRDTIQRATLIMNIVTDDKLDDGKDSAPVALGCKGGQGREDAEKLTAEQRLECEKSF